MSIGVTISIVVAAVALSAAATTRGRRGAIVAASVGPLLVALTLAWVPVAGAQAGAAGAFSISPSRRDLVARPPVGLVATRVANTTAQSYDVRVFAVLLGQDLSGAFRFSETPAPLRTARAILGLAPSRFRLAAGGSRAVALRWKQLPLRTRAAYIGVVFQGRARVKGGRAVPVISRLLSINFLRRPGRYHARGAFSVLHAGQFAPRALRFLPRVRNTGDIVAAPQRGRLTIRDATEHVVSRARWVGDVILPGAQREFPVDVRRVLPAGRYRATATMRFGGRRRSISRPFTLVGPSALPTPRVRISAFAAHGDVGEPAHLSGKVQSTGTAPATIDLTISLFRVTRGLPGPRPLATRRLRYTALAPGARRAVDADLARGLVEGQYRAVARYTDPTGAPQQITSDFAAAPHRGWADRLNRFVDRHALLLVVMIAVLVILLLLVLLLGRQRRLVSELRAARAARDDEAA